MFVIQVLLSVSLAMSANVSLARGAHLVRPTDKPVADVVLSVPTPAEFDPASITVFTGSSPMETCEPFQGKECIKELRPHIQ